MGYLGIKPANSPLTSELIPDGIIATSDLADLAVTPAKMSQKLTLDTAKASTSGTSIDFTGIPSWARRITVMFNGVSVSGVSSFLLRLGTSGTPTTSGYFSTSGYITTPNTTGVAGGVNSTAGFVIQSGDAGYTLYGSIVFTNISGNTWVGQGNFANIAVQTLSITAAGSIALSGILNIIRITTVNGTDAFDAGSINIMYEG
jgi:hypothetical protein